MYTPRELSHAHSLKLCLCLGSIILYCISFERPDSVMPLQIVIWRTNFDCRNKELARAVLGAITIEDLATCKTHCWQFAILIEVGKSFETADFFYFVFKRFLYKPWNKHTGWVANLSAESKLFVRPKWPIVNHPLLLFLLLPSFSLNFQMFICSLFFSQQRAFLTDISPFGNECSISENEPL